MLYKQAANIAQRVWSSLRKTVPGLPKKYTGQFNSVLPLNPGAGKGTSRLYNKGVGDYRFKRPNLGDRTLIEAKGGQYIGGLNPENAHWWFKPKGEKVYSPLARYDESLLSKNLKNNYRIKADVGNISIDSIKPWPGKNGIIGLFSERDLFNIPNAAVGDPQFMQKLEQARILRKAKGKPKPRDLNYRPKPKVFINAEKPADHGGSQALLLDNKIRWAPALSAHALDNNLNFRSKGPLATNGIGLTPISLSSAKTEALDIDQLLHEANHFISFNKPKNRRSFALARKRFIPRTNKKAERLGIDPYVLDYIEAAQYGLHAKEGLAALKNEPLGLIPKYRLPATRIAAGVSLFKSSPQEILKTIDKMYDVPLDSLMSVSPEFTRSVLATANTRLRATDATRRLNLQRQLAQVKHNNVSKALNLLEQWKAKGSVDATTYSTLHDNLRRMSKQLTQGTDTLKAQAKELQSVNRRYRKMFKDASYTRAVWDRIPSHFIEKV